MELVLWILAMLCWLVGGAYGTYKGDSHLVALGWVGFVLAGLTFVV